jgi:fatty-acyl-CoA synthase
MWRKPWKSWAGPNRSCPGWSPGAEIDALRTGSGPLEDVTTLDSPLCIIYTGGARVPKEPSSPRAAAANAFNEMYDCGVGNRQEERGLIVTPFFHSAALLCWLVPHFIAGATSVIAEKFNDELIVDIVGRERITNTFLIPNMMRRLMENGVFADPAIRTHLKAVHTGAGLLRMPDKRCSRTCCPTPNCLPLRPDRGGPMVTGSSP